MGIREIILVVVYLTSIVTARTHEPQVYEDLFEDMPEIVRRARHSDGAQNVYQPPVFDFRTAKQQDRMRSRYHRQQQVDFNHLHIKPINPDEFFELSQRLSQNREIPRNIAFQESDNSEWKPFRPNYITTSEVKSPLEIVGKSRFPAIKKNENTVEVFEAFENDLDSSGSENIEKAVEKKVEEKAEEKSDRRDENARYIYVQPNILKNNFGMDSKAVQEMLRNAGPANNAEKFQITELQQLLGKNPEYQLKGLKKLLLEEDNPVMDNSRQSRLAVQEETVGVEIHPNSLPARSSNHPPIEDLQKQLDAVNQAHADAALAAAQKQAEAHVRAQHNAIALAQKQAEEAALAMIKAHNQGEALINPNDHSQVFDGINPITAAPLVAESPRPQMSRVEAIIQQLEQNSVEAQPEKAEESVAVENVETSERQPLHARPYEQVLLNQHHEDGGGYAPSYSDLRNSKPILGNSARRVHQPTPFAKVHTSSPLLQPLAAIPEIYASSEIQNYAPVVPEQVQPPVETIHLHSAQPTESTYVSLPPEQNQQEHRSDSYQEVHIDTSLHPTNNQLYSEEKHIQYDDLHQYAAKYAFGYRILDEKHGNDFGHEEKREGKLTKGHYFVLLPDGRRQKVEYFVDNSGYHAKVSYENIGRHPKYLTPHTQEYEEHGEEVEHEAVHE